MDLYIGMCGMLACVDLYADLCGSASTRAPSDRKRVKRPSPAVTTPLARGGRIYSYTLQLQLQAYCYALSARRGLGKAGVLATTGIIGMHTRRKEHGVRWNVGHRQVSFCFAWYPAALPGTLSYVLT